MSDGQANFGQVGGSSSGLTAVTVPTMHTWNTAETPRAEILNSDIRDAVNFFANPPRCQIGQTQSQQVNAQQVTPLALDTLYYDNNSFWNSSNPSLITFNTPGVYQIRAYLHWNYVTGNQAYMIAVCLNTDVFPGNSSPNLAPGTYYPYVGGTKLFEDDRRGSNNSNLGTSTWVEGLYQAQQGDYVQVFVYQLGGVFIGGTGTPSAESTPGNQAGGPGGLFSCQVTARWVGQA
jgi:hypothetical protein